MNYKLGLCSISFRKNTPEEILAAMQTAGLEVIEWGSDIHAPCDDFERLQKIVKLQKQYGIKCCSYGTYFRLGQTEIQELPKYIEAAKVLGTNVLRLWCGTKSSKDYTPDEWQSLLDNCRAAVKIAEAHNVTLCLECHRGTATDEAISALEIMAATDSPNFRMYWQPETIRTAKENIEYAKNLSKYTVNLHVFNWEPGLKKPLGEAVELWQEYLENFNGEHCLLLEFMPDGKIESLKSEAESLKLIVGGTL